MSAPAPCLVIAGTHSGVGKTTVALALMAVLRLRGLTVQPFKVGPDFIDPGLHTLVCGRTSHNLDTWMMPEAELLRTYHRACVGADVAVVEGVLGLFDGRPGEPPTGSTAELARLLSAPVVLVIDAGGMAGSAAALVHGFGTFDAGVTVAGALCNRVAGRRHYEVLSAPIQRHTKVAPVGWLPRRTDWHIPERHLGLTTAEDLPTDFGRWEQLGRAFAETVDLDALLALARPSPTVPPRETSAAPSPRRTVAVARDAAFCFYYADNLDRLVAAGARLAFFSPLRDERLPAGTEVVVLGGGYPELHAATLAANEPMRQAMRKFHADGGPIYAECGGLMAVGRELVDADSRRFPMFGLAPIRTVMQNRRAALGYVDWRTTQPSRWGPANTAARGHEFHYSRLEPLGPLTYDAELETSSGSSHPDGIIVGGLWAGYAHLHFSSNPALAAALVG